MATLKRQDAGAAAHCTPCISTCGDSTRAEESVVVIHCAGRAPSWAPTASAHNEGEHPCRMRPHAAHLAAFVATTRTKTHKALRRAYHLTLGALASHIPPRFICMVQPAEKWESREETSKT
ncbi:uncharacterized protein KRP23_5927 [Phytophthora ramorum]|uniref:uncharacterized protein n=1 Tax=Phytophthora ramorum TaxID=164328 RepID=UPI0030B44987|nr:hypothetical protein KRP23_5927 [Phytophthora ramorum]